MKMTNYHSEWIAKDHWGRCKETVWRIYGKERCTKNGEIGYPSQKYPNIKKDGLGTIDAKQMSQMWPSRTIKVARWLRKYKVNKLDYDNIRKDTIVVRDPKHLSKTH